MAKLMMRRWGVSSDVHTPIRGGFASDPPLLVYLHVESGTSRRIRRQRSLRPGAVS